MTFSFNLHFRLQKLNYFWVIYEYFKTVLFSTPCIYTGWIMFSLHTNYCLSSENGHLGVLVGRLRRDREFAYKTLFDVPVSIKIELLASLHENTNHTEYIVFSFPNFLPQLRKNGISKRKFYINHTFLCRINLCTSTPHVIQLFIQPVLGACLHKKLRRG